LTIFAADSEQVTSKLEIDQIR